MGLLYHGVLRYRGSDLGGRIATEFPASQQAAVSFLPTMVFLWFLVLSTPAGD